MAIEDGDWSRIVGVSGGTGKGMGRQGVVGSG